MSAAKWQPFKPFRFSSLLPPWLRKRLRDVLVFDAGSKLVQPNQSPSAEQRYRSPSPASQPQDVNVPSVDKKADLYNINYYTRDVRRMEVPLEIGYHPSLQREPPPKLPENVTKPSLGMKIPAVFAYDPTGTRCNLTTTEEAREKLVREHVATHMVRYEWEPHQDEILKECEAKNIPPVPGRPFQWDVPACARVRRW